MNRLILLWLVPALAIVAPLSMGTAAAQSAPTEVETYFDNWFDRVDRSQREQPHWITPIATTTPRLEEEFRYDQYFEKLGNGGTLDNFDAGKGLELIPAEPVELIFGLPPYIERKIPGKPDVSGFNDMPFLLVKTRLLTANEQSGNYILTAFLQGSAPTGVAALTSNTYMITPTIAGGFGIGDFDIQTTLGLSFPTDYSKATGDILTSNTTFQYHLWSVLWPEFEVNYTRWLGGSRAGKDQVLLTPGLVVGRFPLGWRAKLIVGMGYQIAVAPATIRTPLTPQFRNNLILTTRVAF